ncbi:FAD synthase-like protein [Tanacetum coccineum]|uniref:FAD synthase-like protein n=1 Tax=Tanacetum coccineum TaxID=301880 RepID=A0ABQ5FMY8_9ASTR
MHKTTSILSNVSTTSLFIVPRSAAQSALTIAGTYYLSSLRQADLNSFSSYTSIGSINDTVLNALLCVNDSTAVGKQKFRPTYMLSDGRSKRAGRARRLSSSDINDHKSGDPHQTRVLTASSVAVGDEKSRTIRTTLFK